jgi:hypothetical protein
MINNKTLDIHKIKQFNTDVAEDIKGVYQGLWSFQQVLNSLRFTYRTPKSQYDETDVVAPKEVRSENDYFQRLVANDRTLKIIDFLISELKNKNSVITFPSTFIVSLQTSEISDEGEYLDVLLQRNKEDFSNESFGVFYKNENEIILPELDLMLIVDGQHRLAALKMFYFSILINLELKNLDEFKEETQKVLKSCLKKIAVNEITNLSEIKDIIENFNLCFTLLLDFDIWEQGKVFADVNFNQKPVNRSLYYDIYGSYPNEDKNEIYLLHKWCVKLNTDEDSELKGKINLLGNGNGFISQAFLCDALLPFMRKGGVWYRIANDFTLDRQDDTNNIEKFLKAYFNAISIKFGKKGNPENYFWPSYTDVPRKFDSILLKTTGLGAMIGLIPNVYNIVVNSINSEQKELETKILDIFDSRMTIESLSEIYKGDQLKTQEIERKMSGEYYFSKSKGNFSGGAGKGLQGNLYNELMKDLKFTRAKEKEQFSLFN